MSGARALTFQAFPAGEDGFFHAPVILYGQEEAILIDGCFRWSEGRRLAQALKDSGRRLTTIYVSCNDPDFYFGLKPVCDAFAEARVIAAPDTQAAIAANLSEKLLAWREALGDDGPATAADLTSPAAFTGDTLVLEGQSIEIIAVPGMFDRRYLWVESLGAVVGGTLVVSGNHVWMADTPRDATIAAWVAALDAIQARHPSIVIPGHWAAGGPQGEAALRFTRDYLITFQEERARAADGAALAAAMSARYPDLLGQAWLELGARVVKGELTWGRAEPI